MEHLNKIEEKATLPDIAAIRDDMQQYATHNSLRDLRREVLPDVKNMTVKVQNYQ